MRYAIGMLLCLLALGGPSVARAEPPAAPLVPLHVRQVLLVNNTPAVLLMDEPERRYLLMFIDFFMAHAIRMGLDGTQPERPLTHDLMGILLRRLGARVERIAITELRENTYYALISVRVNGGAELAEFDSRPSDAVALAVRNHSPILAASALLKPVQEGLDLPAPTEPVAPEETTPRGQT